jgi:response regulator RpfG family c-di-GMP phosphodiesterase
MLRASSSVPPAVAASGAVLDVAIVPSAPDPADLAPTGEPPLAALLAPGEPLRALVVDDEHRLRQLLVRVLAREGFECRDAGNGAEALAVLADWPAPLVLSDLRMPEVDGVELLRGVRLRHPDTAVVMVTAVADVDTAVRCLGMGAADYLTKPFHLDEVRARVRQALSRRRLVLDNRAYQRSLEARVADQARRLEQLFLASVASLADALEVKDPYTRGHSARVGQYAEAIGRAMGADADVLRQLELGGHLHDLGKIGVREAVLNKAGPLTDDEYAHVMQHPVIGWRLLRPLLDDAPLALAMVRWHHERHDGRGAPDGLIGDAVPFVARIAAVADSFDAMTSHRPYRRGRSLEDAVAELRRSAGTQFHPEVVVAFERAVAAGEIALED